MCAISGGRTGGATRTCCWCCCNSDDGDDNEAAEAIVLVDAVNDDKLPGTFKWGTKTPFTAARMGGRIDDNIALLRFALLLIKFELVVILGCWAWELFCTYAWPNIAFCGNYCCDFNVCALASPDANEDVIARVEEVMALGVVDGNTFIASATLCESADPVGAANVATLVLLLLTLRPVWDDIAARRLDMECDAMTGVASIRYPVPDRT